jgi:hypothetical protein
LILCFVIHVLNILMQCNTGLSKFVVDSTNLLIEPFETENIKTFKLLGLRQKDKWTKRHVL